MAASPSTAESSGVPGAPSIRPGRPRPWVRRWLRNQSVLLGGAIVLAEAVLAVLAAVLAPYSPYVAVDAPLLPPGGQHLFGTDDLGRDILSRVLAGAPVSLLEGVVVVALAFGLAIPLGLLVVEVPALEVSVMRSVDALLAFPGMLLALALVAVLGPSLLSVLVAVGISSAPPTIVLVRGTARSIQQREFVSAARALGAGRLRVALRHLLPNIAAPLLVSGTFRVASAVLISTSISFLGLGAQPPSPEWGSLLSNGRDLLYVAPHVTAFPGLAILLTVIGFNLLGDGLRDVLDPRLRV